MFCPNCGQETISAQTKFCSRCGFLLTAVGELLQTGGQSTALAAKEGAKLTSPRTRGLKQGLFIFLLTFLVVPLTAIISIALRVDEPFGVAIAAILFFIGGLLRMAYALMFESKDPVIGAMNAGLADWIPTSGMAPPKAQEQLPSPSFQPANLGNWRDTNDLQPTSVVESTTKLLDKDRPDQ